MNFMYFCEISLKCKPFLENGALLPPWVEMYCISYGISVLLEGHFHTGMLKIIKSMVSIWIAHKPSCQEFQERKFST